MYILRKRTNQNRKKYGKINRYVTNVLESNNTLPFMDILLIRNINKLEFKV